MEHHDLLAGFVRLHVLHHAAEHEIYGQWMIDELARHGYRLSPGTLYPMLHTMELRGYLTSRVERVGRSTRKFYRATEFGLRGLMVAKLRVREFIGEARFANHQNEAESPDRPDPRSVVQTATF